MSIDSLQRSGIITTTRNITPNRSVSDTDGLHFKSNKYQFGILIDSIAKIKCKRKKYPSLPNANKKNEEEMKREMAVERFSLKQCGVKNLKNQHANE